MSATGMMLPGDGSKPPANATTPTDTSDNLGIGSKQSGYAKPDQGPFECSNCVHFDGSGSCDNPTVMNDPEVMGQVEAEGCCNLFRPSGGETDEMKTEPAGKPEDLMAGARFPKASNTPNYQGD